MTSTATLRALAHPLRLQILSLLTGTERSAAEIARELNTTQANASYHVRVLARAGLLVPAGEERLHGGLAKRYRHPWRSKDRPTPQQSREPGSPLDHQALIETLAQELVRRSTYRRGGGGHFTDAELWVDPGVYEKCVSMVKEASALLHDAARPPRTEGTVRAAMSAVLFMLEDMEPDR